MIPKHRQTDYPLGLILFAVFLAIYKAVSLTLQTGADGYRSLALLGTDTPFLAVLFMFALLQAVSRPKWLRGIFWLMLVIMTIYYLVDSFVLLELAKHPSLFEIGRYLPEWGAVISFFDSVTYFAILSLLVSMFVYIRATPAVRKFALVLLITAVLSALLSNAFAPQSLRTYAMLRPQSLLESLAPQHVLATAYSNEEIGFYAGQKPETAAIPASKPDIILLIVESLSSINSRKVSGNDGFLDDFDKLAEEGILFRNFFANHQASEGGLIALLGGFPPMHFPTASPYMFDEFAIQQAVVAEYRQQGYFTDFLTNAELSFIGLNHFLDGLGVDRSRGRDEVETLRSAPRVVQDAPSDAYLYREALSEVRQLRSTGQPFLLTIATTSTHLPYTHPEGGRDTPQAVWKWSMQALLAFYAKLSESGFFDHGILLITGDHRQMRLLSDVEILRYGDSARARVPLLAIGRDYPRGRIDDRFFQQSDLLRMLGKIQKEGIPLSPHPIWVERYNRKYGHIELIDSLGVFDEADQGRHEYRVKVSGNRIEWLDGRPGFARQVESQIHGQRSLHQRKRNGQGHPSVESR
ncbi:MAG TPA: sulfatase-like hydrolase/transferase [Xanthomonadales bacterium]